uniref:CRIB domain-containing protein n=1 Tax=Leersia perrieri TaxID=77586 RepID=A0A0D9VMF9_9ORYZ
MKGLLKGLRYISQIFDAKEPEMQIGNPTDVKHVAHIGWDNASVTAPSWMNEYKGGTGGGGEPEAGGSGGDHKAEQSAAGGGGRAEQSERPRRGARGKEGSRRPQKTEAGENCEGGGGESAAPTATKQRRRKGKASGTSSGRSKSSSGGGGGGCAPPAEQQAARPDAAAAAAEDDGGKCY